MKQILKALDEKLKAQQREIDGLRAANRNLQDIASVYRNDLDDMAKRIQSVEASRYRIWEKVCHANKEWQQSELGKASQECQDLHDNTYKWLNHLDYVATHAPEEQ